jgi:hypothetical protein
MTMRASQGPTAQSRTTTFTPATDVLPSADPGLPRPHGIARRSIERFALIAFGLYHLPLFLNNYPSLGGGGFSDTGLAAKWGHLFTVPGIWVARHLFDMTGPMHQGRQGDNGDVGEEFGRLLLATVIGVIGAAVWTTVDRRRPRARWVGDVLQVMLRYSIALGLIGYGVAKLLPQQFPPISPGVLEQRVGDLTPMSLLWTFMQYSRPYAFFGGVMEMAAVFLLCFRRTATLGALVCLAVMTNVALLNLAYGVPVKLYALMIVVSCAVLVLYDAPRLWTFFVRQRAVPARAPSSLPFDRIPTAAGWSIKVALVGSVIVSSVIAMRPSLDTSKGALPIDGGWSVTSFNAVRSPSDSAVTTPTWRRVVVQNGRVSIRLDDDRFVGCRQTSAAAAIMTLACSRNRAGELKWTLKGNDLQLDGTFDGARVSAAAQRVDYALLRSEFRWISDR